MSIENSSWTLSWPHSRYLQTCGFIQPTHKIHVLDRLPNHSFPQVVGHRNDGHSIRSRIHGQPDVTHVRSERMLRSRQTIDHGHERRILVELPESIPQVVRAH